MITYDVTHVGLLKIIQIAWSGFCNLTTIIYNALITFCNLMTKEILQQLQLKKNEIKNN